MHESKIVELFEGIKDIKAFEEKLNSSECRKILRKHLENYNANEVGFLRWAVTEPSGRQTFSFKKENGSKLVDDQEAKLISAIWYNLFLENREHYLTERVWKYMEKKVNNEEKNPIRMHFVFSFLDDLNNRITSRNKNSQGLSYNFNKKFLQELDSNRKINSLLKEEAKKIKKKIRDEDEKFKSVIINENVLESVRYLHSWKEKENNRKIIDCQEEGIKKTIRCWTEDDKKVGPELSKCFKLFYNDEIKYQRKKLNLNNIDATIDPKKILYYYEVASKFLFMWQNIAIFYPDVKTLHVFAYILVNRRFRSSLHFFFTDKDDSIKGKENDIFNLLMDIESAVPSCNLEEKENEENFTKKYPLWSRDFNKLDDTSKNIKNYKFDLCQKK
jgi:hypothetical protein